MASFFIKGLSIVINLAFVPITINYVNSTQYGIWLTLSAIIGWLSFFDIGFGNGLRNKFTEAKTKGDYQRVHAYISTTYIILTLIFCGVWLIFCGINNFLNWHEILNVPKETAGDLSTLALLAFSFFCLQMIFKTINTILIADQKTAIAGFIDMLGQMFALGGILLFTYFIPEGSLIYLALSIGIAPVLIMLLASIYFFSRDYRFYFPKFSLISIQYAKEIMSLGSKFFLIQISAIVIFQTTNVIISQQLGPDQVTVYNIAYKYYFLVSTAFAIILTPLWPAFTDAYVKREFKWMKSMVTKLNRIWFLSLVVVVIMFSLSNFAFKIWLGTNEIDVPTSVSMLLAIYTLIYSRIVMFNYLINGIGKVKIQLITKIISCVMYVPSAIFLCEWRGLDGIVWANILIAIILAIIPEIQLRKLLNGAANGIWAK